MEKFCVKGYLKRSGKRVLSILLCVCMIGTMIPITARAETEGTSMPSNGEVTCTCANLCTEDKVNSDCPVCGAEEADLSKCTGKVQSENNENQLNTGESEEAENETELTITGWEWIDEETSMPSNGEVTCNCANLCTEDKVNSDCPVCGAEEADLSKCTGKVQSENNENQLNTGESEEAKNETELTITGWEWIDEEECINPETGILALPFANEETPAFFDDVVALLPTQIQATVVNEEDIEAEAASETITLGDWSCEEYPKEGAYSGSYTFAAALPEGYVLSEEDKALTVLVELGGAQTYESAESVTVGAFTVTGGALDVDYTYADGVLTIISNTPITIRNTDPNTATSDRIEVEGSMPHITLAGVNIDVSASDNTAAFKNNSLLGITLAEGSVNKLKSGSNCAGLQMTEERNVLRINKGEGELIATGGDNGAGIGGGNGSGSNIYISGGTVTAIGGDGGAGIGGGDHGKGSNIEIYGGTVTATGSGGGAGIGGGNSGYVRNIKIHGGTVTATGSGGGAGIGGGDDETGSDITISGGTVTATGGSNGGAGIGGGHYGTGSNITISGGTVTATGGGNEHGGAGIGGGNFASGSNIYIYGGTVTATGSGGGAGIGGGDDKTGSDIEMNGDAVLYTSSINGHTFTKGVVYDGVTVSGDAGSYTLAGGVGTVYGNPNVSEFTKPTGSKLGTNLADTDYITVTVPDVDYTGAEALPTATVTVNKTALSKTLVQDIDYTVSVSSDDKKNAGAKTATITAVTGSGNVGEITGNAFNVKPVALSVAKIEMSLSGIPDGGYVYDSNEKKPVPVVTLKQADGSEYTLIKDTDYTVSYSNNTDAYELLLGDEGYDAGKAPTVTITAVDNGNFTGSKSMNFKIYPADMSGFTITPYSGSYDGAVHDVVSFTTEEGFSDYRVYYSTDNKVTWITTMPTITDAGTLDFYVKVTKSNYKDWISEKQTAKVTPVALDSSMILFNDTNHYYTGQEVKPEITVKDSAHNRTLVSGTDYTVSYTNNTSVSAESSKAKVTITAANGNYTGSASAEFNIEYANVEYMNYCTVCGTEGKDGWYSSDVTIQNMTDPNSAWGALQFSDSPTGTFADSYTVSEEGERDVTIWFKQTTTGYIGSDATTVKIDKTAPTWTEDGYGISVKENWWKKLANTISFGLFYKDATVDVKVCAKDNLSGIDAYYYYIDNSGSTTVKTKDELDALVNGSEFIKYSAESSESPLTGTKTLKSLSNEGKYVVYAYAVDMAGNRSAYICTSGVVLDTTAPTIRTITTPSKEALTLTDTSAKISFTGSEAGTCFYMVKKSSEPKPTSINDFAISSEDKGMTVWTAKTGVSSEVMTTESKQITLSNLSPNTPYILYLAAVDKAGNSTATIESVSFTTCKTMPTITTNPTICGTYGDKVEDMTLTDGVANYGGEEIAGTWAVTDSNKADVPGVGTTDTYKVTFTPDASYNDIYDTVIVPVKPTVSKRAITVTIDDKAKAYGQANPKLTFTVPGTLVGTDTKEDLGITLTCAANESSPVKAGGYAITGTSNSANYQVTVIPGVLTITKATPTITASNYTRTYGDIKFFLEATDDSAEASLQYAVTESKDTSGDTVENDAVVTVDARGYVTIKGAGTAKITASLPETANYNAASKEITIVVNPAAYPPNMPGTTMSVANSCEKVGDITLPNSWKWRDTDKDTTLAVGSPVTVTAEYNGVDKGNYVNETVSITITRSSCDHVAGEILYTGSGEQAPTCTVDGKGHRECTVCQETIESGIIVKAAHSFSSAWTIDVPATKTSEGSKSHHCTVCGEKNDITVIPKLPSSSGGGSSSDGKGGSSSGRGNSFDGSTGNSGNADDSTDTGNGNTNPGTVKPTVTPGTPNQGTNPAPGENPAPGTGNNNKPGSNPVTNTGETTEAPFIRGENGKEGWDVIRDEVNRTQEGKTVTVDMNGSAVVPGDVLDEIKGKDITIVFDMGNGITWSVNGQSITGDTIGDIDFTVTTNTNTIPVDIINNVTGERYSTQISLAYDGEFGFTAVLSVNMDASNAGLYANLFYYNEKTGELEFICYDEIAADGTAELTFTHASDYAIVIDTEPMDKGADEADGDKAEASGTGNDSTQSGDGSTQNGTEVADGTWNPLWLLLIGAVVIVIGLGVFFVRKKEKPEDKEN